MVLMSITYGVGYVEGYPALFPVFATWQMVLPEVLGGWRRTRWQPVSIGKKEIVPSVPNPPSWVPLCNNNAPKG